MQFVISAILALASLPSFGTAQTIDPSTVDKATRQFWCQSQQTQCPLLCLQLPGNSATTRSNSCDPDTLNYACICGNGQTPNVTEYSQTIPYFTCTESNNQCVKNCGDSNPACQSTCRSSHPCGAQDPKRVNTTSTSTMPATGTNGAARTASNGAVVYSGLGGAAATTAAGNGGGNSGKPNAGNAMINLGQSFGFGLTVAGLLAGFALVL